MSQPPIRIEHVSFSYPDAEAPALDDVSLSIERGSLTCILGGNGSGKSTLLRLADGLALPTSGRVVVAGIDTAEDGGALRVREHAAYVFQHPTDQIVASTCESDIAFGPENLCVETPELERRVATAASRVGMADARRRDPSHLSGGEQQRIALAGTLAMEPEILLLDEVTSMLDEAGRRSVWRTVEGLRGRGVTIVWITHFMEEAARADRVIVMDRGRIALDGTPHQVFSRSDRIRGLHLEVPRTFAESRGGDRGTASVAQTAPAPDGSASPVLSFRDVSFSHNAGRRRTRCTSSRRKRQTDAAALRPALDHVSFDLAPGSITALVGRTGSGKSTVARLACGLIQPSTGRVTACGHDTSTATGQAALRGEVGYVAQLPERQLFAQTVAEDVAFGPHNLDVPEEEIARRVESALEAAGLPADAGFLSRSPFELSGGERRGLALAGVLAMEPHVLVLDEPSAGLDPEGRANMHRLLVELKDRGGTILLISHDLDEVASLADRVLALDAGRLVADCDTAEFLASPFARKLRGIDEEDAGPQARKHRSERPSGTSGTGEPDRSGTKGAGAVPDPRAALICTVIYMVSCLFISNLAGILLAAAALGLCAWRTGTPARSLVSGLKPVLVLLVITSVINLFFSSGGALLLHLSPVSIHAGGVRAAVLYTVRFALLVMAGVWLMRTQPALALADAAESALGGLERFGIPVESTVLTLTIALRFAPILSQELAEITEAQRVRGAKLEGLSVAGRIAALAPLAVPLFAGAIRHADNLGLAMAARCYTGGRRTHLRPLAFAPARDLPFVAACALYLAALILVNKP